MSADTRKAIGSRHPFAERLLAKATAREPLAEEDVAPLVEELDRLRGVEESADAAREALRPGRPTVPQEAVEGALLDVRLAVANRLHEKGRGSLGSVHEILGIIADEAEELREAIHRDKMAEREGGYRDGAPFAERRSHTIAELRDVAVGAIFGLACIEAGTLDW